MSECALVFGNLAKSSFSVVEVCLAAEKRKELEKEGVKIPSLNGNSFQVKGEEKFVRRMARGIGEEGIVIKTSEGSYSGPVPKAAFLKKMGGVMMVQVLGCFSFEI